MQIIGLILFVFLVWYLFKKRSLFSYRKGVTEVLTGDTAIGLELLRKASRQGLTPAQEIQTAYAELKYGDEKQAKAKLNLLLMNSKAKKDIKFQARCMMAIIHLQHREISEAREILEDLRLQNFRNSNFYATYGYMAILTRDREYYTKANEEAYQFNPDNLVICDNYAWSLYLNEEYDKAREQYHMLMEKEPKFPEAYYNYACVLEKTGETEKAAELLSEALNYEFTGVSTIKREQVEAMLQRMEQ